MYTKYKHRFATSAKTNENVSQAGDFLVEQILKNDPKVQSNKEKAQGVVPLVSNGDKKKADGDSNCPC